MQPEVLLCRKDGLRLAVNASAPLMLGREHHSSMSPHISRQQCMLELCDSSCAKLTTLGKVSSTRVLRHSGKDAQVEDLPPGQSTTLDDGDQVCLLPSQPEEVLTLCMTSSNPASAGNTAVGGSDQAKPLISSTLEPESMVHVPDAFAHDNSAGMRPVVLVLVGVPGAGKSTFSAALQAASPGRWERVNQDTVSGAGRKGSRPLCVAAARAALQAGRGAIIDRCNWDIPQRKDFIALAKEMNCEAHAIVLDLPTQLCANRAAARVDHEGGLDGPGAKSAVYRLGSQLAKAGRPQPTEGLSSIMVCNSEADVRRALQAWSEYRTSGKQPIEQYRRSTPAKRTLATLWGKHGNVAAAGARRVNGSQVLMTHEHAGSSPKGKAASEAATCPEVQIPDATGAPRSSAVQPDRRISLAGYDGATTVEPGGGVSETLHNSSAIAEKDSRRPGISRQEADTGNAFAVLMSRAKQPAEGPSTKAPGHNSARRQQCQPNSWKDALRQVAVDPDRHSSRYPEMIVSEDCILIHDAFPKAAHHALVLPRDPSLHDVRSLNRAHIPLLKHMKEMAESWIASHECSQGHQMGFHSVPSMDHLHMHVISKDFDSPKLKTKQHWNSFTTAFFIPLEEVLLHLEARDAVAVDRVQAEALLKQPLRCHKCQAAMKNMPDLKSHIAACTAGSSS